MKIDIDISVIIPAFNAVDSIGALVHTLLGETTLNPEIIVVDDGSTDETWTLLSAITDERLILIRQENQGVYAARNAALARITCSSWSTWSLMRWLMRGLAWPKTLTHQELTASR